VIGVADGESVGERVVKRDIGAGEVGHGHGTLARHPLVVFPTVPGALGRPPVVGKVFEDLQAERSSGRMKGQDITALAIGLIKDRTAGRQGNGSWIGEAAYTIQRTEVMIERPVLLHEDDDVFDVRDAATLVRHAYRQCPCDTRRKRGSERGTAQGLQEGTPVHCHRLV
jgi:hypothetical protein